MACRSMTGYGQAVADGPGLQVKAEIRSVNHRFLEMAVRLPREWLALEDEVRTCVQKLVARGRVEVYITTEPRTEPGRAWVDWPLLQTLCDLEAEAKVRLAHRAEEAAVRAWLMYPGVMHVAAQTLAPEHVRDAVLSAAAEAAGQLTRMREREGERLAADLAVKVAQLADIVEGLAAQASVLTERFRQRIAERLVRAGVQELDASRLYQEVVLYTDKAAIDEEVVRLKSHIAEFRGALAQGSPVGRRLDFIVQEMQRELNTIGSKAADAQVSKAVVDGKVIVEQLREQVQNIE